MNLEGYEVTHKAFGNGIVQHSDDKYVTVRFANLEKTFVYPDAFKGFMQIMDDGAREIIEQDIAASDERKAKAAQRKEEEREIQMRTGIVVPGMRIPQEPTPEFSQSQDDTNEEN